jgi:hypothetical protein
MKRSPPHGCHQQLFSVSTLTVYRSAPFVQFLVLFFRRTTHSYDDKKNKY